MVMKNEIYLKLRNMLSEERYNHSLRVQSTSVKLAKAYNIDIEKASAAGLLHDCAKGYSDENLLKYAVEYGIEINEIYTANPQLLHGPVGSFLARHVFNIDDPDVIHSIYYHTTGCENMSMLDKIIYIADFIEPGRDFPGVDKLRKVAYDELDISILMAMDSTIRYVIERKQMIDTLTVRARNSMLISMRKKY